LRDFSILKGGHFGLLLTGVDNLTIDNLTIDTDRDGMDIDCCRNVHVSNCTVNSPWDDGICPKSSYSSVMPSHGERDDHELLCDRRLRMGTVLDGTFKRFAAMPTVGRTGRIKCGPSRTGASENIAISNCVFDTCNGLALESEDGALLRRYCRHEHHDAQTSRLRNFYPPRRATARPKETTKVGTMRRILISNLKAITAHLDLFHTQRHPGLCHRRCEA